MYPAGDRTDQASEIHLAELIREQILRRTREELPHAVEVEVSGVRAPRGRDRRGPRRRLGRDRLPEGDPDRQGRADGPRRRDRRPPRARARARRRRSSSTSRSGSARAGVATSRCWTGSGSTDRSARIERSGASLGEIGRSIRAGSLGRLLTDPRSSLRWPSPASRRPHRPPSTSRSRVARPPARATTTGLRRQARPEAGEDGAGPDPGDRRRAAAASTRSRGISSRSRRRASGLGLRPPHPGLRGHVGLRGRRRRRPPPTTTSASSTTASPPTEVPFVSEWGFATEMNDLHEVIERASRGGRKVILGGHSRGASSAAAYAAWDFKRDGAGYQRPRRARS